MCFEQGGSGETPEGISFQEPIYLLIIFLILCTTYHKHIVYRESGLFSVLFLHFGITENPDPLGQIVAHISMLQNFVESIHQHVAESIKPCLIHFLRKSEGSDEEEIHYLVALLVFGL